MIKQFLRVATALAILGGFLALLGVAGQMLADTHTRAASGRQIPSITPIDAENVCRPAIMRYAQDNADRVDRTGPRGVHTTIEYIDFKPALTLGTHTEVRGEVHYSVASPSVALPAQLNVICTAALIDNTPTILTLDYER